MFLEYDATKIKLMKFEVNVAGKKKNFVYIYNANIAR